MQRQSETLLSFVIPLKDESASIKILADRILAEVDALGQHFGVEIILVDDGSTDQSWEVLCGMAGKPPSRISAIRLRRNMGKAFALEAGFRKAKGNIILTMDADLQDDPAEIPRFIRMIESGYDMVSGWKTKRHDPIGKTLPSRLFNKITAMFSGLNLHDFNCGFKAYKREVIDVVHLHGELHRFIPVLAHSYGFRGGELGVMHHPRAHGVSKYGWERLAGALMDLITVMATTRWRNKPGRFFGGIGLASGLPGGTILIYLSVRWFLGSGSIGNQPLWTVGVLLCVTAVQMVALGVMAEFLISPHENTNMDDFIAEVIGDH